MFTVETHALGHAEKILLVATVMFLCLLVTGCLVTQVVTWLIVLPGIPEDRRLGGQEEDSDSDGGYASTVTSEAGSEYGSE